MFYLDNDPNEASSKINDHSNEGGKAESEFYLTFFNYPPRRRVTTPRILRSLCRDVCVCLYMGTWVDVYYEDYPKLENFQIF